MSLFGDLFLLLATFSLAVQVVVLLLLLYGYRLKVKNQLMRHARVMTAALALHLAMIFTVMIPSFVLALIPVFIIPHVLGFTSIATLIHVLLGVAAVSLGLYLVLSWRFRGGLEGCFARKKFMAAAMTVWVSALVFGVALYSILYWHALMG